MIGIYAGRNRENVATVSRVMQRHRRDHCNGLELNAIAEGPGARGPGSGGRDQGPEARGQTPGAPRRPPRRSRYRGGRRTQQERQQIAQGWPTASPTPRSPDTSTVRPRQSRTREAMRNGGPTAYRADPTHRATECHTHRRRQATPQAPRTPDRARGNQRRTFSGSWCRNLAMSIGRRAPACPK